MERPLSCENVHASSGFHFIFIIFHCCYNTTTHCYNPPSIKRVRDIRFGGVHSAYDDSYTRFVSLKDYILTFSSDLNDVHVGALLNFPMPSSSCHSSPVTRMFAFLLSVVYLYFSFYLFCSSTIIKQFLRNENERLYFGIISESIEQSVWNIAYNGRLFFCILQKTRSFNIKGLVDYVSIPLMPLFVLGVINHPNLTKITNIIFPIIA
jgi:hypothetical protein